MFVPQFVNKFLVWHKKFGPLQNILGPVKGQGIIGHINDLNSFLASEIALSMIILSIPSLHIDK